MTLKELHTKLSEELAKGNGEAEVMFDSEARTFNVHLVELDDVCVEDRAQYGYEGLQCVFYTRYH